MPLVRTTCNFDLPMTPRSPDVRTWTPQMGTQDLMYALAVGACAPTAETQLQRRAVEAVSVPLAKSGGGSVVTMRPYQNEAIEAVSAAWKRGSKSPLIVLPTACHRAGQGVLMMDGTVRNVEDVQVGDVLLGPDSKPRNVLKTHHGFGQMFEIVPVKGKPFVVNGEHVLTLYRTPQKPNAKYPSQRSAIVDVTVNDVLTKSKTWRHIHKLIRASDVEFSDRDAPVIPPYFLGLYIADGSMAQSNQVAVSKPDPEVRAACIELAESWGLNMRTDVGGSGCPSHHLSGLTSPGKTRGDNHILTELRKLGLMNIPSEERFVPDNYKFGSIAVRTGLLSGFLDGDGHLHRTDYDVITKSKRLSDDIVFVARSLGLASYSAPCMKGCQNGFTGNYFRVIVSGETSKLKLRIPRKQAPRRTQKKNPLVAGFSVRRLGEEPFFGFTLDSDHRYLLDDFTITHNSGKTIISAEIMARTYAGSGEKSLFVAHREELLTQTVDKVRLVSPNTRVGLVQGKIAEFGRDVTVASIQTIGHSSKKKLRELIDGGPYRTMIVDECHHATGKQYRDVISALMEANPSMLIMGMTATPGRSDGLALDAVFDSVAFEKDIFSMIREGWLVPPVGFAQKIDVDLDKVATGNGDYVLSQLSKLMNTPKVNRAVVEAWQTHGLDRKFIAFACDVAHAKALAQEFNDSGYPAASVDGKMKKAERKNVLTAFREGALKILVNCNILIEGYDDPSAEGVLFARPTQSQGLHIQSLGRGLRLFPGKTECLVIDCVGNSAKHRPVQLASLVGFDPQRKYKGFAGFGNEEEEETEKPAEVGVDDARLGQASELGFGFAPLKSTYQWRETSLGWIIQIPKIGYYLVAWSDKTKVMATIRFYDQRKGRKTDKPREVTRLPIEFDMAYGLVEGELDRMFRAKDLRREEKKDETGADLVSFVPLDDGLDEDLSVREEQMLKDAEWRNKPKTEKQRECLESLGVKMKTMPELAGEASDLITIMRVEKELKMRVPATLKQLNFLRFHGIPFSEDITKGQAAKHIWLHRKATEV